MIHAVDFMMVQLHNPIVDVFAVKKLYPLAVCREACIYNPCRNNHQDQQFVEKIRAGSGSFLHGLPQCFQFM